MNINHLLKYATQRISLLDASLVVLFKAFVPVEPGDSYAQVIQFLRNTGGENRNVFRVSESGEVIWQVSDHHWRNDSSSDPFSVIADQGSHLLGSTGYGFEYKIDKTDGTVQLIRWFKM